MDSLFLLVSRCFFVVVFLFCFVLILASVSCFVINVYLIVPPSILNIESSVLFFIWHSTFPSILNIESSVLFFVCHSIVSSNYPFLYVLYKKYLIIYFTGKAGRSSSIGSVSAWHASGPEFDPHVQHIFSWGPGHEKSSTAILLLPLIQEEQLSVTGERMCTKYW